MLDLNDPKCKFFLDADGQFVAYKFDILGLDIQEGNITGECQFQSVPSKELARILRLITLSPSFVNVTKDQFLEERNLRRILNGYKLQKMLWVDSFEENTLLKLSSDLRELNVTHPDGWIFIEVENPAGESNSMILSKTQTFGLKQCRTDGSLISYESLVEIPEDDNTYISLLVKSVRIILRRFAQMASSNPVDFAGMGERTLDQSQEKPITKVKPITFTGAMQYDRSVLLQFASLGTRTIDV